MKREIFWRSLILVGQITIAGLTAFEWAYFYANPCAPRLGIAIFISLVNIYLLVLEAKSD